MQAQSGDAAAAKVSLTKATEILEEASMLEMAKGELAKLGVSGL
jgi:hypothetical protein